jgi:hypothetical protein
VAAIANAWTIRTEPDVGAPWAKLMGGRQDRKRQVSFSFEIDQRIIKGFLVDREATLQDLEKAGFSRQAVLARTEKLGLTGDLLKRHRLVPLDVSARRCLNCDEVFLSIGPQNRLCNACRKRQ